MLKLLQAILEYANAIVSAAVERLEDLIHGD